MTWSYDSTAPYSSATSFVRLLIGDTDSSNTLFEDEEIEAFISAEGNNYSAAAAACEALAAQFAQRADQKVGQLSIKLSQIAGNYERRAHEWRQRARRGGRVYAGGISASDVASVKDDVDQVRGRFEVGMTDFPDYESPTDADLSTED